MGTLGLRHLSLVQGVPCIDISTYEISTQNPLVLLGQMVLLTASEPPMHHIQIHLLSVCDRPGPW